MWGLCKLMQGGREKKGQLSMNVNPTTNHLDHQPTPVPRETEHISALFIFEIKGLLILS